MTLFRWNFMTELLFFYVKTIIFNDVLNKMETWNKENRWTQNPKLITF